MDLARRAFCDDKDTPEADSHALVAALLGALRSATAGIPLTVRHSGLVQKPGRESTLAQTRSGHHTGTEMLVSVGRYAIEGVAAMASRGSPRGELRCRKEPRRRNGSGPRSRKPRPSLKAELDAMDEFIQLELDGKSPDVDRFLSHHKAFAHKLRPVLVGAKLLSAALRGSRQWRGRPRKRLRKTPAMNTR
jgi:hypothetical protein